MTAEALPEAARPLGCWCCGGIFPEDELTRLGAHPEVGLCLPCATWVKRRAVARYHDKHPSVPGRLVGRIHALRTRVIERGWHRRGRLGALLRRIDRYLP